MPEENKTVQITTESSDYQELPDRCVRGLRTLAEAKSLQELTIRVLDKNGEGGNYRVSIEEHDGLFDMIVLKRIN